jgi:putative aldouronate transport system substrate-binding protein
MLRDHNVIVSYIDIFRWNEVEELNNLLAAGEAPDVSYTFNWPTVESYGQQEAVWDMHPYIDNSQEIFPHLWDLLGSANLYWNQNNETGAIWSVLGVQAFNQRTISFIREDWLAALDLDLPSTLEEYEAALMAFRDNAELLLGADADQIVPLHMTQDIGWVTMPLIESFLPNDITDRELYIYDVGGPRNFFRPGAKEAIRVLNRWYNEGLIDPDFVLYGMGDDIPENQIRAGFTGAMMHSWDQPYRGGDQGQTAHMQRLQGDQANFIAVNAFQNDAGYYRKILGSGTDRNMFFPATNTEPVASMLYLDWISKLENRMFLQIGFEGINHEVMPDGAVSVIAAPAPHIMNSGMNYDLTMPINGLDLGDLSLTARSRALGYAGIEARLIEQAVMVQSTDVRIMGRVNVASSVTSEDGMGDTIRERSNAAWARAIVAPVADFDAVYDAEIAALLRDFAQASIDERTRLWAESYGDADMLP